MRTVRRHAAWIAASALSAVILAAAAQPVHAAGSVKAGRDKARVCEACHGLDGRSKVPEAPNLAGQVERYMVEQLQAFKTGQRKNEIMTLIAASLAPQDIEDLAAYYAAIETSVGKIPAE